MNVGDYGETAKAFAFSAAFIIREVDEKFARDKAGGENTMEVYDIVVTEKCASV